MVNLIDPHTARKDERLHKICMMLDQTPIVTSLLTIF